MNKKKLGWVFVALILLITIGVSVNTLTTQSQSRLSQQEEHPRHQDIDNYPVVEYNGAEVATGPELEARTQKSQAYNKRTWVQSNPHPETGAIETFEDASLPSLPSKESDIVIVGDVVASQAHLSTDKKFVYSEFKIAVREWLKAPKRRQMGSQEIIADRPGGIVRYPTGQKVIYRVAGKNMPKTGGRYLFFLRYHSTFERILTAYEITGTSAVGLDYANGGEVSHEILDSKRMLESVRNSIAEVENAR